MRKKIIPGLVMILVGIGLMAYPLFHNLVSEQKQQALAEQLRQEEERRAGMERVDLKAALPPAEQLGGKVWLEIPKIGITAVVVYGTSTAQLDKGPGFMEGTASPGQNGNVVIAGHRNTGGFWFRHLDKMEPGDEIILRYYGLRFEYTVQKVFVVDQYEWTITEPIGYPAITLFTCHPYGSTEQRLVVRGKLENSYSVNLR